MKKIFIVIGVLVGIILIGLLIQYIRLRASISIAKKSMINDNSHPGYGSAAVIRKFPFGATVEKDKNGLVSVR